MPNYLLAYHGGGMPESEAEQARVMAAWGEWYQKLGDAVVDPGNPIAHSMTVESDGSVSEGSGSHPVTGYTVIKAGDIDTAVDYAKGCPLLASGGSIEVGETLSMA
jgi:hypothetical protein